MTKKQKLLEKAQNNPRGLKFADFETLLRQCGWSFDHQTGSHRIWISPSGYRLSLQERRAMAKSYQVKQFLNQREKEQGHE